jgi:hypothetical protein
MQDLIYQWIDCLWLPIGLVAVRRGQRLMTTAYIATCIISLRTQLELMSEIGYSRGFLGLTDFGLYERGLVVYGLVIALFLVLAHFSPRTKGAIFLAAIITLYIFGFCASTLIMFL